MSTKRDSEALNQPTVLTQKEIDKLYDLYENLSQALDILGVQYIVIAGSLLGSIRSQSILFNDDDIDIALLSELDYSKVLAELPSLISKFAWYKKRPWPAADKIRSKAAPYIWIDLFLLKRFDSFDDIFSLVYRKDNGEEQSYEYVSRIFDPLIDLAFAANAANATTNAAAYAAVIGESTACDSQQEDLHSSRDKNMILSLLWTHLRTSKCLSVPATSVDRRRDDGDDNDDACCSASEQQHAIKHNNKKETSSHSTGSTFILVSNNNTSSSGNSSSEFLQSDSLPEFVDKNTTSMTMIRRLESLIFPIWHYDTRKAMECWPREFFSQNELFPVKRDYVFGHLCNVPGPARPIPYLVRAYGMKCFREYPMQSDHSKWVKEFRGRPDQKHFFNGYNDEDNDSHHLHHRHHHQDNNDNDVSHHPHHRPCECDGDGQSEQQQQVDGGYSISSDSPHHCFTTTATAAGAAAVATGDHIGGSRCTDTASAAAGDHIGGRSCSCTDTASAVIDSYNETYSTSSSSSSNKAIISSDISSSNSNSQPPSSLLSSFSSSSMSDDVSEGMLPLLSHHYTPLIHSNHRHRAETTEGRIERRRTPTITRTTQTAATTTEATDERHIRDDDNLLFIDYKQILIDRLHIAGYEL